MVFACPDTSESILDHLQKAVDVLCVTARRAIAAGDVEPRSWHTPLWQIGFEDTRIYATQDDVEGDDGWEQILNAPTAHGALTLRDRYEAGVCEALDHLVAFRDGLLAHHPALAATIDRLGGFYVQLQGGGKSPLCFLAGTILARGQSATKIPRNRWERSAQIRSTWKKVLSLSARIGPEGALSHYQAGGLSVAAPNAAAAAVLAGAILGLNADNTANLHVFHEQDMARQAAAVRALLRRPTTTTT